MSSLTPECMNEYWTDAWKGGYTGWKNLEKSKPFADNLNAAAVVLKQQQQELMLQASEITEKRVAFVPLCGDTFAMRALLDLGVADCTIGIDLSADAVESAIATLFFGQETFEGATAESASTEFSLIVDKQPLVAVYKVVRKGSNSLTAAYVVGDFFAADVQQQIRQLAAEGHGDSFTPSDKARLIDLIYDRASMIALPPSLRASYVQFLVSLSGPNVSVPTTAASGLWDGMVFLELARRPSDENQLLNGPPFHIPNETVLSLYDEATTSGDRWTLLGPCTTVVPPKDSVLPFTFQGFVLIRRPAV